MDGPDPTPVAKQPLPSGDIDLGVLDQDALARVIVSGQQQQNQNTPINGAGKDVEDEDEEDGLEDVTYRPSAAGLTDNPDPIWSLRMACVPVLDIFVLTFIKLWVIN